jgi:5'-3' exonuclease
MMLKTLAVDGDILAYRTAAVCEDHFEGACQAIIDSTLRDISTDTNIPNMRIFVSGSNNFRYNIAKTKPYKGNRATMVRPQYLEATKQYLVDKYGAVEVNGYEADDAIATDMTQTGAIHCGIDKDMLQIAGQHYNYVKKEWTTISEEEAILILYRQVLMGDASDNIPGLPRIGEKKAADAIQNAETALDDAIAFYKQVCEEKLPDINYIEYMSEQMNLIKMVTDISLHCIDFNTFVTIEANTEGFEKQEGEAIDTIRNQRSLKL